MRVDEAGGVPLGGLIERSRRTYRIAKAASLVVLVILAVLSFSVGAVSIPISEIPQIIGQMLVGDFAGSKGSIVLFNIRLPRTLMAMGIGAMLALSGAIMQGLFRNPLADPGLVGVSSGAALAAGITIVLGDRIFGHWHGKSPFALLPFGAFLGGLASTTCLYLIATRRGRTSVATLLLAGIALGAISGALSGFLAYLSDDRQLRDLTFWTLGSLGGSSWSKLAAVAPVFFVLLGLAPKLAHGLNGLAMGEAAAFHAGFSVQRIKLAAIILVALAVGAGVAVAGMIGFVGIVVPHLVRLILGADHSSLLPLSAIVGAILLLASDIAARLIVAPAELPIGIITAALGAPFFLWLLMKQKVTILS